MAFDFSNIQDDINEYKSLIPPMVLVTLHYTFADCYRIDAPLLYLECNKQRLTSLFVSLGFEIHSVEFKSLDGNSNIDTIVLTCLYDIMQDKTYIQLPDFPDSKMITHINYNFMGNQKYYYDKFFIFNDYPIKFDTENYQRTLQTISFNNFYGKGIIDFALSQQLRNSLNWYFYNVKTYFIGMPYTNNHITGRRHYHLIYMNGDTDLKVDKEAAVMFNDIPKTDVEHIELLKKQIIEELFHD